MAVHGSVELQLVSSKEDRLPFTYWNFVDDHFVSYHFTKSMIFSNTKKQIKQTSVYIYKHLPTCVSFFKHPPKKKKTFKKKTLPAPRCFSSVFYVFFGGKKTKALCAKCFAFRCFFSSAAFNMASRTSVQRGKKSLVTQPSPWYHGDVNAPKVLLEGDGIWGFP